VAAGVEKGVESQTSLSVQPGADLRVCVFGPLAVERGGVAIALPASRKVQALLVYLALSPVPVTRSRLCTLFWDVANDPRGELRWCLTKLRAILGRDRVVASGNRLALDLSEGFVDATAVAASVEAGLDSLDVDALQTLSASFSGDFMEGLEIERCPAFNRWLAEQRSRFAAYQAAIQERLAERLPTVERWCDIGRAVPAESAEILQRRAALAVMPFRDVEAGDAAHGGGVAAGLTYDIITRLAKLRHFFVIAQGSVFALAERDIGPAEAGRRLDVDYVAGGSVRRRNGDLVVTVELVETRSGRLVWSENFERKIDDFFSVLDEIGNSIVSSIAAEIETVERNCAILKPPSSLNAWEAYHRGLWHMYRFTREENATARHFFETAIRLDPTFSRAHAGISFTYWQSAFQRWDDLSHDIAEACDAAGQSLMVDDRDPVAHWAMGRALWLHGRHDESLTELQSAVDLSPNFALGHYALSFVQSQSGDPKAAILSSDHSRKLSPFDPMLFGMLGTRAIALARMGDYAASAEWALKAAARPNAHANILAIAAHCLALAGRLDEARGFVAGIRKSRPDYRSADFLSTFHFQPETAALFQQGARQLGLN